MCKEQWIPWVLWISMVQLRLGCAEEVQQGLVVHEWGTFTSISGDNGIALDWRPLAGPSDLPSFVYRIGGVPKGLRLGTHCSQCGRYSCGCGENCKPDARGECPCKECMVASVRMETPVLYFYAPQETTVFVNVDFPKGKITEWYPQAREVGAGITWGFVKVMPGAKCSLPSEKAPSHYYPARETDSTPIRVCGVQGADAEYEKFLFYRGAGTFDLPLRATLTDGRVRLESAVPGTIAQAILFEKKGKVAGYRICQNPKEAWSDEQSVASGLPRKDSDYKSLKQELEKMLVAQGLYPKEAKAMIKTWQDSWFEEGLRIIYVVPRAVTDAVLPLTLEPKPKELVRVLVGRLEILTPQMEQELAALVVKLDNESYAVREEATRALKKLGRFAEPVLKKLLKQTQDAEIQDRIKRLLER